MSVLGLQVEAFLSQTLYLASPAIARVLTPPILPLSSLPFFLQRVDSALSACTHLDSFPP